MRINPINNQAFKGVYVVHSSAKKSSECINFFRDNDNYCVHSISPRKVLLLNGDDAEVYKDMMNSEIYDSFEREKLLQAFANNALVINLRDTDL